MLRRLIRAFLRPDASVPESAFETPGLDDDTDAKAWLRGGLDLERRAKLDAAIECYRAGIAAHPSDPYLHAALANALNAAWRNDECIEACVQAVHATGARPEVFSGLLMFSHYAARPDAGVLFRLHRQYGERMAATVTPAVHETRTADPMRRLRVGYVSADLRLHSVTDFLEPLIVSHDRSAFEVHCYYTQTRVDAVTERLRRAADAWHPADGLEPGSLAQRIAADGIDVLVDLAGHTNLNNLPVFARRPAPVQITWLGYPDTTGLATMDYRITDGIADPQPRADTLHSERLLRIEPPFVCYRPPPDSPPAGRPQRGAQVVFGSFNMFSKVNEPLIELWSRILDAVPGSRLLVKSSLFKQRETLARARAAFARHGIGAGRLDIRPWAASRDEHLPVYNEVDIALDTFPYNGTTTTCEALWMGVPVVTLAGDVHMSRVGATLLTAVGLESLVAAEAEQYVEFAVRLGRDPEHRAALSGSMRERMTRSPLLDHAGFARRIESAYRAAWRAWCEKKALREEGLM